MQIILFHIPKVVPPIKLICAALARRVIRAKGIKFKHWIPKQQTPLFNPRQQSWVEHFAWSEDSTEIIGLTACGRATVEALKMNNLRMVRARRLWASVGWHPLA